MLLIERGWIASLGFGERAQRLLRALDTFRLRSAQSTQCHVDKHGSHSALDIHARKANVRCGQPYGNPRAASTGRATGAGADSRMYLRESIPDCLGSVRLNSQGTCSMTMGQRDSRTTAVPALFGDGTGNAASRGPLVGTCSGHLRVLQIRSANARNRNLVPPA